MKSDPKKWRTWRFRAILTQTDVGGGILDIRFTPGKGNELIIEQFEVGPDDYSGGESMIPDVIDGQGTPNSFYYFAQGGFTIDNQRHSYPSLGAALAANSIPAKRELRIVGTHSFKLRTSALAQNETLTVNIQGKIKKALPTVDYSNSTGTQSISTTYNEAV